MTDRTAERWTLSGVALTAGATLILELALTRILSVIMYHHFAFLTVSMALFGLGVAGVVVYVAPGLTAPDRFLPLAGRYALYAAGSTLIALIVILHQHVGIELGAGNLLAVSVVYLSAAVPFFLSGLVVSLAVNRLRDNMSRLYFADLSGAALGCLILVPLLDALGGAATVLAAALCFVVASAAFAAARPTTGVRRFLPAIACTVGSLLLWSTAASVFTVPSAKDTREDRVIFSAWNSFSRITVETTPEDFLWMKIDSSAATRIFSGALAAQHWQPTRRFSEIRVASLAHSMRKPGRTLILGPGGGADVISALYFGQHDITAVEVNPIIATTVMRERFREYSGALYDRPEVKVVTAEGRNFVRQSPDRFAVIQATLVDTWAATAAGAFALSENNLYTRQAFDEYLRHLDDDGVLTMTRWLPPREFLRLLVLGRAALDDLGVTDPAAHFYVAADARLGTFLLKRTAFTAEEIAQLDAYVRDAQLTRLYSPFATDANMVARLLREPDWHGFVADFPDDISPPSDERPFFFYTVRPDRLLAALANPRQLGRDNLGLVLLVLGLGVALVLVVACVIAPLAIYRRQALAEARTLKLRYLAYFAGIGAGFIIIEMVFLQRFMLLLGHPVWALAVVLFTLLAASGAGSLGAQRVARVAIFPALRRRLGLLTLLLAGFAVALPATLDRLAGLPLVWRILVAMLLIAPAGLLLGPFLPLGVRAAEGPLAALVPWAWGLNGAASVLGSIVAVALSMHLGFTAALLTGLACYGAAVLALPTLPRVDSPG